MSLSDLPNELILEVVLYFDFEEDINSLARTTKRLYSVLNSYLYRHNIKHYDALGFESACKSRRSASVRKFFNEFKSFGLCDRSHRHMACATIGGYEDIVKYFLEKGVDPNDERSWVLTLELGSEIGDLFNDENPFEVAIMLGHEGVARLLAPHIPYVKNFVHPPRLDHHDPLAHYEGEHTMEIALEFGHLNTVKLLVEEFKCNIEPSRVRNVETGELTWCKITPLARAANKGHTDIVQYLLSAGASPNAVVRNQWYTVLWYAVSSGNLKTAQTLIEHGAEPDPCSEHIRSSDKYPLAWAAIYGDKKMVNLLLRHIDLERKIQCEKGDISYLLPIAAACGLENIVQRLLEKGCNVNATLSCGYYNLRDKTGTALSYASEFGHTGIVEILLNHDANLYGGSVDADMRPLAAAVSAGHQHIVELLLDAGTNPNPGFTVSPFTFSPKVLSMSPQESPPISPQESPSMSPQEPPSMFPQESLSISPQGSPSMSPQEVPSMFPQESPSISPQGSPSMSPEESPSMSPEGTPSMSSEESSSESSRETSIILLAVKHESIFKLLLNRGADPHMLDSPERAELLEEVIRSGNLSILKALLDTQLEFPIRDALDLPVDAMMLTAKEGPAMFDCMVQYLWDKYCLKPTPQSRESYEALESAIMCHHAPLVEKLLSQYGLKLECTRNHLALAACVSPWGGDEHAPVKSKATLDVLLRNGADINTKDSDDGQTCLYWLIEGQSVLGVELVIERGVELLPDFASGMTPLAFAVELKKVRMVKTLLRSIDALGLPLEDIKPHLQHAQTRISRKGQYPTVYHDKVNAQLTKALQYFYWRRKYPVP